jgi:hypothetical protein
MDLSWLFGGVSEKRDRALAEKLSLAWELDELKIGPLLLRLDDATDMHEKAVIAAMISFHIHGCYDEILMGYQKATATVPRTDLDSLSSTQTIKQIAARAQRVFDQMEAYAGILSEEEVRAIMLDLQQKKRTQ